MKNNFVAMSIFSLAVSIVIGSWLISNGLNSQNFSKPNPSSQNADKVVQEEEKKLLTQEELASYLGLSVEESKRLGPVGGTGSKTSVLPFIQIGEKVYYSKDAIDKWLEQDGVASVQLK